MRHCAPKQNHYFVAEVNRAVRGVGYGASLELLLARFQTLWEDFGTADGGLHSLARDGGSFEQVELPFRLAGTCVTVGRLVLIRLCTRCVPQFGVCVGSAVSAPL